MKLLEVAKDYLDVDDGFTIIMPEVFMDIPSTTFTNNGNARTSNNESFGGLNDMNSSLVNAIMMAMQSQQPSGGNMEISLEMNARKVAEIVIKEVNKITRQTGTIPLKL